MVTAKQRLGTRCVVLCVDVRSCAYVCACVRCALFVACVLLPSSTVLGVGSPYCVQVLSSEDGHCHLARTARELCEAVQRQEMGPDQIDVSMVEERCRG